MNYSPLPFQDWAAQRMVDSNILLADHCGLGKTITTSWAIGKTAQGPALIVCRKTAKAWWASVLETIYPNVRVAIAGPAGAGLPVRTPIRGDVWITHTEALSFLRHASRLAQIDWDIIVVDEAHNFKNRKAKRTVNLRKIRSRVKWALTATPYGRNPGDMWAILNWLYPREWKSYWRFYNRYVDAFRPTNYGHDIINGGKNLDELGRIIAPYFIRRSPTDAGVTLPPVSTRYIPVQLSPQESEMYVRLRRDMFLSWSEELGDDITVPNKLVLMMRLQQMACDPSLCVPYAGEIAKQVWLEEWLSDHEDEGVIVVSRFRDVLSWPVFDGWPKIMGGVNDAAKELDAFNHTGRLVGTFAIAESLNLQRANNIIIVSGVWSPDVMYQMTKRIERIGQDKACTVYWLQAVLNNRRPTVDSIISRTVDQRLSEAEMLAEFAKHLEDEE